MSYRKTQSSLTSGNILDEKEEDNLSRKIVELELYVSISKSKVNNLLRQTEILIDNLFDKFNLSLLMQEILETMVWSKLTM